MNELHQRFRDRAHFAPSQNYRLLPFRFGRFDASRYIATNDVGEYVLLSRDELVAFTQRTFPTDSDTYRQLNMDRKREGTELARQIRTGRRQAPMCHHPYG